MKFVTFFIILLVTALIGVNAERCRNGPNDSQSKKFSKVFSAFCRFNKIFTCSTGDIQEKVLSSTPDNTEYTTMTVNSLQSTTQTDETSERVVTEDEIARADFRCNPGQSFKLDCNRCWCAKNGKQPKSCTRMSCSPATYDPLDEQDKL